MIVCVCVLCVSGPVFISCLATKCPHKDRNFSFDSFDNGDIWLVCMRKTFFFFFGQNDYLLLKKKNPEKILNDSFCLLRLRVGLRLGVCTVLISCFYNYVN